MEMPKAGEIRTGTVVRRDQDEILVGIGAKSEGIIPARELAQLSPEELENLQPGAEIAVYIITPEDQGGNLLLSYERALVSGEWDRAERLQSSGELFEGTISGYNKGGLIVKLGRLAGFAPASQLSPGRRGSGAASAPDQRWGRMTGEKLMVRVLEVDRERERLIVSELAGLQETRELLKKKVLSEIRVGEVLEGRVTSLAEFGAFVNVNGADGLVHVTEIAWGRIEHPSDVLKVGQTVKVEVINVDEGRKRIGLSIRRLLADPWPEKAGVFREGQLVSAQIVRLAKFGAFARIEDTDLEGLIHISEISEQRIDHPKEVLNEGENLTLRIIRIDPAQHRIGLSLRKVHSQAYADIDLQMALGGEEKKVAGENAGEPPASQPPDQKPDEDPGETTA